MTGSETEETPVDQKPINRDMIIGWLLILMLVGSAVAIWKVLLHVA